MKALNGSFVRLLTARLINYQKETNSPRGQGYQLDFHDQKHSTETFFFDKPAQNTD